jgi:5-methylcytosine-specific restriction endonuclease McrA
VDRYPQPKPKNHTWRGSSTGSTRAWRTQRARILSRDGHQCTYILPSGTRCEVIHPVEVHHLVAGTTKVVSDDQLVTVCRHHHGRLT